jgi:ferredoxin--NADP+ reductase
MHTIVAAIWLAPDVRQLDVVAPRVAAKWQPGQFIILRVHDRGERIPLTVVETNHSNGTIRLIVQGVGKTTRLLNSLEVGQAILDVVGPLGTPTPLEGNGRVVVVAGGVGAAIALPIARAVRRVGRPVRAILGARNRERVILEEEFRAAVDALDIVTDDGSAGRAGLVTDVLSNLLAQPSEPAVGQVFAIGPVAMMRAVAEVTRPCRIPTLVSLNAIMVDGTGMCGGCRVIVGGAARFACVDGPDFDAHQVDFDVLAMRNRMYQAQETVARERFAQDPGRDLARVDELCRLAQVHPEVSRLARPEES